MEKQRLWVKTTSSFPFQTCIIFYYFTAVIEKSTVLKKTTFLLILSMGLHYAIAQPSNDTSGALIAQKENIIVYSTQKDSVVVNGDAGR